MTAPDSEPGWDGYAGSHIVKLSEHIAAQILADISSAARPVAGLKLPGEAEMSGQYAVGRGTVREALRLLEMQGLISIKSGPGGGPVVTGRSPGRLGAAAAMHLQIEGVPLRQVVDARLRFEPFFARQAALRASAQDRERLMALVDEDSFSEEASPRNLSRASAFHAAVIDSVGNPVLALLGLCLKEIWARSFGGLTFPMTEQPRVRAEHSSIAQAIEAGDPDRAERLMSAHMEDLVHYAHQRFAGVLEEVVTWR